MIGSKPDVFDRWIETLARIAQYSVRDESIGEEPNGTALHEARRVVDCLREKKFAPDRIDASAEGGVTIAFIRGNKYADIECLNTGEILAVTSNRKDSPHVWEVQPDDDSINRALGMLREHVCA